MKDKPYKIKSYYTLDETSGPGAVSRYKNYKRYTDTNGDTYVESPERIEIQESTADTFYSVEKQNENRLDLISNQFYGTPLLWWAIASMNHINNPLDVKAGIILRIPALSSIYDSGVI